MLKSLVIALSILLFATTAARLAQSKDPSGKPAGDQTAGPVQHARGRRILANLQVFPPDNPWNTDVSDWPVHPTRTRSSPRSAETSRCATTRTWGSSSFRPTRSRIDVKMIEYPGESDKGPFPVPDNMPIEGWPANYKRGSEDRRGQTLDDVQRDKLKEDGDRHAIVVDPANRMLYEFYQLKKTDASWEASQASIFDLKSNKLRPDGWTSTDAAGLPIFPSIVRYDELKRGMIEHAPAGDGLKTRRAPTSTRRRTIASR